jgi:DNA-binding MarR family transcriptional regulator
MTTTSPATVTALAARLRVVIARSTRRLRQEGGRDLSPALFAALATIDHHGPLTPSEIAERERVTRPTATRFIAKLHARGLVGRTGDPADKRSSLIAITDEGVALITQWRTRRTAFLSRKLEQMSAEDRATIERAVELLEEIVEQPHQADR